MGGDVDDDEGSDEDADDANEDDADGELDGEDAEDEVDAEDEDDGDDELDAVDESGDDLSDEPTEDARAAQARPRAGTKRASAAKRSPKSSSRSLIKSTAKSSAKSSAKSTAKAPAKRGHADCEFRTPIFEHVVVRGEHLGAIAGRYGVRRSDLIRLNPALKNPNLIRPGQTVRVCPELAPRERVEQTHEIASGETLGAIARRYGMTTRELVGLQRGALREQLERDPNHVRVGTSLRIVVDQEELEEFSPPPEDEGELPVGVSLKPRAGLLIKRPHLAFGTKPTIRALERALSIYRKRTRGKGPPVRVGDISKRGGGPLHPHVSHQRGIDVDIGVVLKGDKARAERFSNPTATNLDVERTWTLIRSLLATEQVRVIFLDYSLQKRLYKHAKREGVSEDELDEVFQYPRGRGRAHGVVRHWQGHRGHMHVRLRR